MIYSSDLILISLGARVGGTSHTPSPEQHGGSKGSDLSFTLTCLLAKMLANIVSALCLVWFMAPPAVGSLKIWSQQ